MHVNWKNHDFLQFSLLCVHFYLLVVHLNVILPFFLRYAGLLLAPAKDFGLWPFFFGKKRASYSVFAYFRPFEKLPLEKGTIKNLVVLTTKTRWEGGLGQLLTIL